MHQEAGAGYRRAAVISIYNLVSHMDAPTRDMTAISRLHTFTEDVDRMTCIALYRAVYFDSDTAAIHPTLDYQICWKAHQMVGFV